MGRLDVATSKFVLVRIEKLRFIFIFIYLHCDILSTPKHDTMYS